MQSNKTSAAFVLGLLLGISVITASWLLAGSALEIKEYERTVSVKGLSEREVVADTAIWPIRFSAAGNSASDLYELMESQAETVSAFLIAAGFSEEEISTNAPRVIDRYAERWGEQNANLRYTAEQTLTVYSQQIDLVRGTQQTTAELGKQGIVIGGDDYNLRTVYTFNGLNDIKPAMVEEATRNARAVAEQFAEDSNSKIGKMKRANQGQFSIEDRDNNTPYLKKVRVVSTIEYYLDD